MPLRALEPKCNQSLGEEWRTLANQQLRRRQAGVDGRVLAAHLLRICYGVANSCPRLSHRYRRPSIYRPPNLVGHKAAGQHADALQEPDEANHHQDRAEDLHRGFISS
jgi:hypothetical protein